MLALVKTLLGEWTTYLTAGLIALCGVFFAMWKGESASYEHFKNEVEIAGRVAAEEKARIEAEHAEVLNNVSNAWEAYTRKEKKDAVAAYIARYGSSSGGMPCSTSQVPVSGDAADSKVLHGAEQERIPPAAPEFIEQCAEDAFFRVQVRTWAHDNHLKIKDAD